jgi:hypothetical protein
MSVLVAMGYGRSRRWKCNTCALRFREGFQRQPGMNFDHAFRLEDLVGWGFMRLREFIRTRPDAIEREWENFARK